MTTIILNGQTYDLDDLLDYGYNQSIVAGTGDTYPRFIAILADAIADAAKQMQSTSLSSVTIGTGTKNFTLVADVPYFAGAYLLIIDSANAANYMYATVTSYTQSTKALVVSVASGETGGSGTISSWIISIAGPRGLQGPSGDTYDISASTAESTFSNITNLPVSIGAGNANNRRMTLSNFVTGLAANSTFLTTLFGKQSIWVPAGAMRPSATGGCAPLATIATSANQPDIQSLDFDATTQEYAQFSFAPPKQWDEGTITAQFFWSHASTTTNFGVVWNLQAVAQSDDDPIAAAYGTAQQIADTGGTTNDLYTTSETPAITIAGSPAVGDLIQFRVSRVTGDASDTMAIDARLLGVKLFFTTVSGNDA